MSYHIATFYHFHTLPNIKKKQKRLKSLMEQHDVKGTVLLAPEGVNGTISGLPKAVETVITRLRQWPGFEALTCRITPHDQQAFERSKVKCKEELIALGEPADPTRQAGTYVAPQEWNALITDPDVTLVDARNDYEYYLGHFANARDPHTRKFRQLAEYTREALNPDTHKKIATYCTGGIRCEKYTAWLLDQGFEEVYHLEGGILSYLEEIPGEKSLWKGDCYVFDNRIAVGHGLKADDRTSACPGCGHPLRTADRNHPEYIPDKQCGYCASQIPSNSERRPDPERYQHAG